MNKLAVNLSQWAAPGAAASRSGEPSVRADSAALAVAWAGARRRSRKSRRTTARRRTRGSLARHARALRQGSRQVRHSLMMNSTPGPPRRRSSDESSARSSVRSPDEAVPASRIILNRGPSSAVEGVTPPRGRDRPAEPFRPPRLMSEKTSASCSRSIFKRCRSSCSRLTSTCRSATVSFGVWCRLHDLSESFSGCISLALVAQLFQRLVDVGLFFGDLRAFFHEGDSGRFELLVLLTQFRSGRLGFLAGQLERPLIGFKLGVLLRVFFLVAVDLLDRLAQFLAVVFEMLPGRLDRHALIAEVVLCDLELFLLALSRAKSASTRAAWALRSAVSLSICRRRSSSSRSRFWTSSRSLARAVSRP